MAISFPQFKTTNTASSGSSISVTFTNPIAAGSFIAVVGLCDNGISTITLSNDKGDAYTDSTLGIVADNNIGTKVKTGAFLSATTGAQTVTLTPDVNFAFAEIVVWEIAGITGPVVDKAVSGITTGTTAATSGSTGTLSASAEAAIGYGIANWAYSAAGSGWTQDAITGGGFNDLCEHQILSSNSSIAATGTIGNTVEAQMFCVTFMAGGGAAAPIWFTTGQNSERLPSLKENPDPNKPWFVRSPSPVPTRWFPKIITENRERDPAPYRRPDEPFAWFVRLSNPVPTTWLPKTGEDVERLPPVKENPDEPKQWFVRSPNPVPNYLWYGQWDQPRKTPVFDQYVITRPANVPSQAFVPISGMAWSISKEEMRPPKPPLNPDEFRQWFVRSPNPVPTTWLPQPYDQPPYPPKSDQYRTSWSPQTFAVQSTIAGMAWWRPYGDERPPPSIDRPAAATWQVELPLISYYAAANADDFNPLGPPRPEPYAISLAPIAPAAASTIAGMAWWRPADDARPPAPDFRTWRPDAPQWFRPSQVPVPAKWVPTTGDEYRVPAPPLNPDEARQWFRVTVPISGMAWNISKEEMRPPPPPDQYVVTWPASTPPIVVNTISGMAWFRPADEGPPRPILMNLDSIALGFPPPPSTAAVPILGGVVRGEIAWGGVITKEMLERLRRQTRRAYEQRDQEFRAEAQRELRATLRQAAHEAVDSLNVALDAGAAEVETSPDAFGHIASVSVVTPSQIAFAHLEKHLMDLAAPASQQVPLMEIYREIVAEYEAELDEAEIEMLLLS